MPQIEEHAKNILRPRKAEEVLFWILRKNHGLFVNATSSTVLCMYNFVFNFFKFVIIFLS